MEKTKVLHLLYSGLGGHGNVFFSMVKADKENAFIHEALFNGVEEVRAEYISRCRENNLQWYFVKKKQGLDFSFYKKLVQAVKKSNPGIIFLHGSTPILAAKIASLLSRARHKIIVRETQANQLKTKQDWFWLTTAMVMAGKVVFLSDAYNSEIQQKLRWVYRKKKVAVIPNGIDLQKFGFPVKGKTATIVLGMQSRIVKIKDHATLLKAFAMLYTDKDFSNVVLQLQIAGDGDCRAVLEELTIALGIQQAVTFTGMLSENDLVPFLRGLDIYIHASYGETMSTAIMQAMACHKPIIASDVPGISNMVQQNITGILVPVENVTAMYENMKRLVADSGEANRLAANAGAYAVEHFSNEKMFARYKQLFLSE